MKTIRKRWAPAVILAAAALFAQLAMIAVASPLKDADGNYVKAGTSTPFSMKKSCAECHERSKYSRSGGRYERGTVEMHQKTQIGSSTFTYSVPAPQHGVTAGYHFQQGRNVAWGDTQRSYYGLPGFTSSPGMYGKY